MLNEKKGAHYRGKFFRVKIPCVYCVTIITSFVRSHVIVSVTSLRVLPYCSFVQLVVNCCLLGCVEKLKNTKSNYGFSYFIAPWYKETEKT